MHTQGLVLGRATLEVYSPRAVVFANHVEYVVVDLGHKGDMVKGQLSTAPGFSIRPFPKVSNLIALCGASIKNLVHTLHAVGVPPRRKSFSLCASCLVR